MHCSVIYLALSVSHRMVRGCSGFLDRVNVVHLCDNLGVKTPSLVRVYPTLNSITEEPLPDQSFAYRLRCLIPSKHCYNKFTVYVRHNQNFFFCISLLAGSITVKSMAIIYNVSLATKLCNGVRSFICGIFARLQRSHIEIQC